MDVPEPEPIGPLSAQTFRYGLLLTVGVFVGGLLLGVHSGLLSIVAAFGAVFLGGPLVVLGASILLARWLDYHKEAQYQSAKYALWNNDLTTEDDN